MASAAQVASSTSSPSAPRTRISARSKCSEANTIATRARLTSPARRTKTRPCFIASPVLPAKAGRNCRAIPTTRPILRRPLPSSPMKTPNSPSSASCRAPSPAARRPSTILPMACVPISMKATPPWNDFRQNQGRVGYEFEHRFNDLLTVRQNLRYNAVDTDMEYSLHYAPAPNQPLKRYWGHYREDMKNFVVDNMAQFTFDTGPIKHAAVAGLDYSWAQYGSHSAVSYVSAADIAKQPVPFTRGQELNQTGAYLHDQMEWNNFTLFASGRYDWVDTASTDAEYNRTKQRDRDFSWRLGLSYRTDWGIIPYANYSTSFSPNIGYVYDPVSNIRRVARATTAEQMEVGVKYEIPDTNAVLSAAYFDISQKDGLVYDGTFDDQGNQRQRQLDLNSRGIELEANASFDNGFGLIASYTHLRMKIEKGAAGTIGKELSATPNDVLALWGNYKFEADALAGLGLGAGIRYSSESYGDDTNSFRNAARTYVDAALSYDFGYRNPEMQGLTLQVNAKNLFNKQGTVCQAGNCYRDEGRSVFGSMRYRF
ncbi:TonB-dependent receptor domain-containing protein [Mesorhizobium sp. UC22_110]|uniref:TonB-dependent receptor domain-containing protein n=1 Tax=Mesorhizobium sp. UC22_110 TaxID=3374552 RepID=UPI00375827D3